MVKLGTISTDEECWDSIGEGAGSHKWYQSLYSSDILMRTSNLIRFMDCDNLSKVCQYANEFKCMVDTLQLS